MGAVSMMPVPADQMSRPRMSDLYDPMGVGMNAMGNDPRLQLVQGPKTLDGTEGIQAAGIWQKLLAPLSEYKNQFEAILHDIGRRVSSGNLTTSDLFLIQFKLTQLTYINDLSSKIADKGSQGIQTLFRNQG